jgi:hypothetical protein
MALKLRISAEELAGLPEGIREFYEEKNGAFVLGVDGLEDTSGLRSALEKERKTARELEKLARQYQGLGKSPDEIAELVKAQEESEKSKLEQKGEWEKLKAQLLESHKKELTARDEAVQKMKGTLESYLVDAAATEAIAAAKGIPQLLLPHVKGAVKVIEEDGKYQVRVVGPDGSHRMNAKGEFLGIKDFVSEMRESEVFSRAFEGTGTTGGGAAASRAQRSSGGAFLISREDARDVQKYRAAKAAASAAGQTLEIAAE